MCISTFYSPPPSYSTRCRDWYQYVHVHVYKICTIYLCAYLHSTALRPLIHYMRIYDWYFRVVWSHSSVRHISMCTSTINIRPFITRDFMTGIVLLRVRLPYYQFSQSRAQHWWCIHIQRSIVFGHAYILFYICTQMCTIHMYLFICTYLPVIQTQISVYNCCMLSYICVQVYKVCVYISTESDIICSCIYITVHLFYFPAHPHTYYNYKCKMLYRIFSLSHILTYKTQYIYIYIYIYMYIYIYILFMYIYMYMYRYMYIHTYE